MSDSERIKAANDAAVAAIEKAGGKVEKKKTAYGDAFSVDLSGKQLSDELIEHINTLKVVSRLNLSKSSVKDSHLGKLTICTFNKVDLSQTDVTNQGILKFAECGVLREINVTGSKVTNEGIKAFQKARNKHSRLLVKMPKFIR